MTATRADDRRTARDWWFPVGAFLFLLASIAFAVWVFSQPETTNQDRIDACVAAGGEPIVTSTRYETKVYCAGGKR